MSKTALARATSLVCSAVLMTLFALPSAKAATVIFSGSVATEVEDLVVDGITYNVTFAKASSAGFTTFNGNSAGAQTAVNELDAALNATTAVFVSSAGFGSIDQFIVQDNGLGNGIATGSEQAVGNWQNLGVVANDLSEAVFTPVITPLPATLPLFATGLGALGLLGWRRKRKAQA
jgi:hypothetical protein